MLNKTCDIKRAANTKDSIGGTSKAWSTLAANVRCRIRTMTGREIFFRGGEGVSATHKIYLPAGTDITEKDMIESGGISYDPTLVAPTSQGDHIEVEAKRRT